MSHMKQYLLENRHLGIAIKQVLNESGMTQVMLADRAEIPRNTLNRKINVGVFNFDELRRIAGVTHRPQSLPWLRSSTPPKTPFQRSPKARWRDVIQIHCQPL